MYSKLTSLSIFLSEDGKRKRKIGKDNTQYSAILSYVFF